MTRTRFHSHQGTRIFGNLIADRSDRRYRSARRCTIALCLASLSAIAIGNEGCQRPGKVSESPLQQLRSEFRPTYDHARARVDASLSPLVVVRFSDLYLIKDGKVVATGKGIPQKYHLLHRTGHVPLVIFLKLQSHFGQVIEDSLIDELTRYRRLIDAAVHDLSNYEFSASELTWQKSILQASSAFLDKIIKAKRIERTDFDLYRASIFAPMKSLAAVAGAAQVDATRAVMENWRKKYLEPNDWAELRVVIIGPRQPREGYAATQYLAAILPDRSNSLFPHENRRVFYVETPVIDREDTTFENERRVVATLLLDESASEAIFHDPRRMSIDVMADGASQRISELGYDLSP